MCINIEERFLNYLIKQREFNNRFNSIDNFDYTIDVFTKYIEKNANYSNIKLFEAKLNEYLTHIIPLQGSLNNDTEIYVNEFNDILVNDFNLVSITITKNKNENNSKKLSFELTKRKGVKFIEKNSFKFNYIALCSFRSLPFDIIYEKSSIIIGKTWILPNIEFNGLWENLEFDMTVKDELLDYCNASFRFHNSNVNNKIISYNRLILFYGEPGSGKTSLARSFSQKLSIKCIGNYKCYKLIEINSNFLLSEYYSQSSKLLTIAFQRFKELSIENANIFYIILIDEIETLLISRDLNSMNINEPHESLRAVNVILTQLDQIKNYKNILIITTSNLTELLDQAFLDRADLKFFIKQPSLKGIYKIYMACINELIKKELLVGFNFNKPIVISSSMLVSSIESNTCGALNQDKFNKIMYKICKESEGLSGRLLRKLPFLTYCKIDINTIENFLHFLLLEIRIAKQVMNYF